MIFGIRTAGSRFRYLSLQLEELPPLYFPSVSDRWFGEGFLRGCPRRGQAQGLLGPVDPEPVVEVAAAHGDVGTAEHGSEDQAYPVGEPWVST